MQFTVIALLAAAASASASTLPALQLRQSKCDLIDCAAELGPTCLSCTMAAVEAGVNPIADAGCFLGSGNIALNHPHACAACLSQIKNIVHSDVNNALNKTATAVSAEVDTVKNVADETKSVLSGTYGAAQQAVSSAVNSTESAASSAANTVGSAAASAAGDISNASSYGANAVGNAASYAAGAVSNATSDGANNVADFASGTASDVNNSLTSIS